MDNLIRFETIAGYNAFNNAETLHPLVSVIDMSRVMTREFVSIPFGFYTISLKDVTCGDSRYGNRTYDYQDGTLVFASPGQVVNMQSNGEGRESKGYELVFHPDIIHGTSLRRQIKDYSFFEYHLNEALHLSECERNIVLDCFSKIEFELKHASDEQSKKLIVADIELLLTYCACFYERQFKTREKLHKRILEGFETLLNQYYQTDKPKTDGLPAVEYFSNKLNVSRAYFTDLVKKETGHTAQEYLHLKVIDKAKEKLFDYNKSVTRIASELGFGYAQYFARVFKHWVGQMPNEYRVR